MVSPPPHSIVIAHISILKQRSQDGKVKDTDSHVKDYESIGKKLTLYLHIFFFLNPHMNKIEKINILSNLRENIGITAMLPFID